jgi:hypothetical protein
MSILEWLGVALGLVGAIVVARGSLWGQAFWLLGNPILAIVAAIHGSWGTAVLFTVYFGIAMVGVWRLRKEAQAWIQNVLLNIINPT